MSRIWRYILKVDAGMAPCPQEGRLSLCCCKPVIRRYATEGDWVIGLVPKGLALGKVAWAGRVSKSMPLGDYQLKFPKRRDAIYRRVETRLDGVEVLIPAPQPERPDYHQDDLSRARDQRGLNALLFDPFWYWGGDGVWAPPEIAEMAHYHPGQSAKNSTLARIEQLEVWLRSMREPGVHGEPREPYPTQTADPAKARRKC
jgi:hypothetical protein